MLGQIVRVIRNDELSVEDIGKLSPDKLVISPGPCTPTQAGISLSCIQEFSGKIPILGVCLGHQAIAQANGAEIVHSKRVMHGKVSEITHSGVGIFAGLPSPFSATRYHSLSVEASSVPDCVQITATSEDGEIMALSVAPGSKGTSVGKGAPVVGVQFHPESIKTPHGMKILENFLQLESAPL